MSEIEQGLSRSSPLGEVLPDVMVEIVCTCPKLAQTLGNSVQWKLLMRYLERQGVSASIWVEGEDIPAFAQAPGFTPSELATAARPKAASTIKPAGEPSQVAHSSRWVD